MKYTRREFLGRSTKMATSGLLGSVMLGKGTSAASENSADKSDSVASKAVPLRKLGRTGLNVSILSLGTSRTNSNTIRHAIKSGINFIHTSPSYIAGWSIRQVAKGIRGQRDKVILGLKVTWDWDRDDKLVKSLKILGTDHVDIIFFPIHNNPDRVASSKLKSTFERWKRKGHARFLGLTTHGGMKDCMEAAINSGWYDCLMPAYQIHQRDIYLPLFNKCEEKQIGIVAMKTKVSPGKPEHVSVFFQDKAVTTICRTMSSFKAVNGYIEALNSKVSSSKALEIIHRETLTSVGRYTMCGTCSLNCPNGLEVSDMVRCVDYYVDTMDDYELGMENYAEIGNQEGADNCVQCGTCEALCPNGVPARSYVKRARQMFC